MRGGASKGVFFHDRDLPASLSAREALLLRLMGSPDRYGTQIDGMGGASSSTSKVAIIKPSTRPDCDIDFTFGSVSINQAAIDWSVNCGHISAAVGAFAIQEGLMNATQGLTKVRIWQVNLSKRIDAYVPTLQGQVLEQGDFLEDGVSFNGGEIRLEFLQPGVEGPLLQEPLTQADGFAAKGLLPTGNTKDWLTISGVGKIQVSLINAGHPTVFVRASAFGLKGNELPDSIYRDKKLLDKLNAVRERAAVTMGLERDPRESTISLSEVPQLAWLAPPMAYRTASGRDVAAYEYDVLARVMSMGRVHPAFTDSGAIALGVAAALPGTIANEIARTLPGISTRIGHSAGCIAIGAEVSQQGASWMVDKAIVSRSARRLMSGWVYG
jgi:2-methylaconitate isomerase